MRKFFLLSTFFIIAPLVVIISLLYVSYLSQQGRMVLGATDEGGIAYAALPSTDVTIHNTIEESDSKTEILRQFFAQYNSPLEPYAPDVVAAAKRYDIDYRLIPAIAMQESTLCRRIPANSNNCWGFGIYGGKVTRFSNYPEAIETVTRTLATKYRNRGLVTPHEIQQMYTPSNTNDWADKVSLIMSRLQ